VAAEIVEGLKYPRFAIFVPKAMGVMALGYSMLPYKARGLLARLTGSDKLLFDVDKAARDKYDSSVLGGGSAARAVESPPAPEGEKRSAEPAGKS